MTIDINALPWIAGVSGGTPSEQAAINNVVVALRTLERAIETNDAALAVVAQQTAFRVYDAISKRVNEAFPSARELRRREAGGEASGEGETP